ncbi:cysteine proteinase [Suhomyces tanzawaensis NRRL Y-17324]|uniref:Cysteine proteinase n=1 Tax=Suhomyces tanzawaensis NRRL Y-17324 TaxID=984487 RepID=A0A1E4SPQ4_9ASCO|nr:cysteine proteinase [Suhomyces tanzawaensis NRRL Y-17324]ODV81468.1 cysteine proteinase [Suhomyces tanzawaensis NRRL Y-17324]
MSSHKPRLKDKPFNSISINKRKQGGGAKPISTLTKKIEAQDHDILRAQRLREELEQTGGKSRTNQSEIPWNNLSPSKDPVLTPKSPNITHAAQTNPKPHTDVFKFELRSLLHNSKLYKSVGFASLNLQIDSDDTIYFTLNDKLINDTSVLKETISQFFFCDYSVLIRFKDGGFAVAKHGGRDSDLRQYFKDKPDWNIDTSVTLEKEQLHKFLKSKKQERQEFSNPLDNIRRISPSKMYGKEESGRATRSKTKESRGSSWEPISLDRDGEEEDLITKPREVPSAFSPDLKHKFRSNKTFTIGYSDFKTLFNNDWINDSVIDFFIEYEIDNATYGSKILDPSLIYAFNSFFFTKLITAGEGEVDYYGNIKRWVSKLDLLQYPYIIMPINENAHWYCCIIRGLPLLKEQSKSEDSAESELLKQKLQKALQVPDSQEKFDKFNISDDNIGEETDETEEVSSESLDAKKHTKQVDIFVLDSLSQRHSNISWPLKKFIIDYSQDKYGIEVHKNQIRVLTARVPKQNNFNDCGIHVIYNIRKWLNNIPECEKIWRGSYLKHAMRTMFVAEERNGMRNQLKDILLKLHKEQRVDEKNVEHDDADDDDIEVIEDPSQTPTPAAGSRSASPVKQSRPSTPVPETPTRVDQKSLATSLPARTLDPKVQLGEILINESLNRKLAGYALKPYIVEMLNELFRKKNMELSSAKLTLVTELVKNINSLHQLDPRVKSYCNEFDSKYQQLSSTSEESQRPKNQPFKIEHQELDLSSNHEVSEILDYSSENPTMLEDSDGINQSVDGVSQLHITNRNTVSSPLSKGSPRGRQFGSINLGRKSDPYQSPVGSPMKVNSDSSQPSRSPSKRRKIH